LTSEFEMTDLRVRELASGDLAAAHGLSRAVQWPHRREDWQFALELGRGCAAEVDGRLVGTAMHWCFGRSQAALGMVIVDPQFQGRGIGRRLMKTALDRLGDRSIALHATPQGQALYARLGFVAVGEVRQHQGAAFVAPVVELAKGERLRPAGRRDGATLAALDASAAGMPREAMLEALLARAEGMVLDRDGEVTGFALLRRSGRGYVIGPVVAPDVERAKALIALCIGRHAGNFLRIDVPAQSGLTDWLDALGLAGMDVVLQMRRGAAPRHSAAIGRYALVNQALG
jgi:predicted N-acetyltransferase YhbS